MRTISHWYHVEGPGYWEGGEYRRTYTSYPVYTDEPVCLVHEVRKLRALRQELAAELALLDQSLARKRIDVRALLDRSRYEESY